MVSYSQRSSPRAARSPRLCSSPALLVIFSRRDSVPSTWAATLLTGALVIAAMVQKRNQTITLHHAVLTMK